ncbi:DNA-processing protein DprA [Thermicanus aegyptius]|uniref:DNA-processing protein DprA n=1 Tax=Thermicanus aegyptius TaxID=94009 RepID=UPI000406E422|nr:DNA-processing protein DprA [Thermicanus aegyptius]
MIAATLHRLPGVGTGILTRIDELVRGDWQKVPGNRRWFRELPLKGEEIEAILEHLIPEKIEETEEELRRLGIKLHMRGESDYPRRLEEISNPPFLLYSLGDSSLLAESRLISIVGTRKPSSYGQIVSHKLAADLAGKGWGVVSGMASGIDSFAHRGALSVRGKTIAVLGCGVDVVYPPENEDLYHEIGERGLLLSEYPPHMPPARGLFPQRNRIISGLSRGVVVVESHHRSGSLITAEWALEQGREVFAVPGSILSAKSAGPHRLIKEGAKLVTSAQDVLDEFSFSIQPELFPEKEKEGKTFVGDLTREEEELLSLISYSQIHIDELIRSVRYPLSRLHQLLLSLEMKKAIKKLPGFFYMRR